ncbi:MAG: diacylglycerol kinase family protein [Alphaproteobacteria bacterium]|nr:diacylglycerol kinase family protein [Alphaproteobacteria bacterium]
MKEAPEKEPVFSIAARVRSIRHALAGLGLMLRTQHNAWIHLGATIVVVAMGLFLGLTTEAWLALILAIVIVWIAEALNTAFELLCDVASPDFHPLVKAAKDVAAGAVLLSAIAAAVVGTIVFLPRIIRLVALG